MQVNNLISKQQDETKTLNLNSEKPSKMTSKEIVPAEDAQVKNNTVVPKTELDQNNKDSFKLQKIVYHTLGDSIHEFSKSDSVEYTLGQTMNTYQDIKDEDDFHTKILTTNNV